MLKNNRGFRVRKRRTKNWRFIETGKSTNKAGTGFILSPGIQIDQIHDHSEQNWGCILSLRLKIGKPEIRITNVYAPHEDYSTSSKDSTIECGSVQMRWTSSHNTSV